MKKFFSALGMAVILLVIFAFVATSVIVITNENEYTLIRQFGKVERVISTPGITLKVPFLQSADKLPNQILLYDLAPSNVITKDKKTMISDCFVLWRIIDPLKFTQRANASIPIAESRIEAAVYSAVKSVISSMDQNDVISAREGILSKAISDRIGKNVDQYGIKLLSVETKRLDLPADNKAAVYERMISERDKIATTFIAEGESQAKVIQNTTDREINVKTYDAQAKAAGIIAEGEGEYMRILAAAYSDPSRREFYVFCRALDSARISLKGRSDNTLILPKNSPISDIFMKTNF